MNTQVTSEIVNDILAKRIPQVGESVIILHEIKRKDGNVLGLQRTGTPKVEKITAVYMDGSIRTGISDRWEVERNTKQSHGNVLWATVNNETQEKRKAREEF